MVGSKVVQLFTTRFRPNRADLSQFWSNNDNCQSCSPPPLLEKSSLTAWLLSFDFFHNLMFPTLGIWLGPYIELSLGGSLGGLSLLADLCLIHSNFNCF